MTRPGPRRGSPRARGRRVVVTGLGVVSSLGSDRRSFWRACLAGESVVEPVPEAWHRYASLRSRVWSPLRPWERDTPLVSRAEGRRLDATSRMALLAAEEALAAAGLALEPVDRKRATFRLPQLAPEGCGVFLGTGVGGIGSLLEGAAHTMLHDAKGRIAQVRDALRDGHRQALDEVLAALPAPPVFNPFAVAMTMPNAAAANLAIKLGLHGPCRTFACACASGTVAIGQAFRAVRRGECEAAVAGGSEHLSDPYGAVFRGFDAVGALAQGPLPPERVNRPFDRSRSGFLFAEGGAAILVLEELAAARARRAPILAEVVGYGETCDAHDVMAMDPSGRQIRRALEDCLADAGLAPADVGYVNAHGTGTPRNDPVECAVLGEIFGPEVPVSSTKSLLGHTLGASGALEAAATALTLHHGRAHPNRNLDDPIADLAFLRQATALPVHHAVTQSFAFGGQNAVLALARL
ncbi:MAG TPA: beta-ketoacyl-[acyl-carrier-protein] synthase family protein [Thermoanaerobaculia bacterium]|nr:beta-ketoacyl-[acyl-carrier-protein] synthase family protein [Thermoanaerobaculia bacterium]